ncbi:MAG: SurA N-terminal domain-containing protein [Candidatus Adiutrix sp.]|jgi:hypothetical protein|nr:SurA N-terminal domain-containing protein [Candidatus Adiutrix sp.]
MPYRLSRHIWPMLLLAALTLAGCREEPWNPEVAGLVNGRPIARAAVNRVLEWGFYPQLGQDGERGGAVAVSQVLDKLIDEQLILAEAGKAGLTVSEAEVQQLEKALDTAWFGVKPPPAERDELRQALRNQILLRKMTEKVMVDNRVLAANEWAAFWEGWPKNAHRRFLVRALMIPPLVELPEIPERQRASLDQLGEYFEAEGFSVIISEPFWLSESRAEPEILAALEAALESALEERRPVGPFRLEASWAAYEALEFDPGPSLEEELRTAAQAFEELAGERAFQAWLKDLKAAADIRINPSLAGLASTEEKLEEDI